ncbi:hypothetical protein EYF80_020892 [Liparis tanakae]|uniref:Uncharacterized protein n=1 Tax=Liparis tanakae TaxID=230148 RepID=A0A4Z2HT18_9TELE|nr:hypothetical protein EYF80_020892 [Liparis tanakae]
MVAHPRSTAAVKLWGLAAGSWHTAHSLRDNEGLEVAISLNPRFQPIPAHHQSKHTISPSTTAWELRGGLSSNLPKVLHVLNLKRAHWVPSQAEADESHTSQFERLKIWGVEI